MAQQGVIIPQSATSTFPGCALSCTTLLQARDVCMPPNVAQSSQLTYDQCFCNSPFLTPFASTADQVCVTECTIQTDRQLLQAWYRNFCAQVRQGIDPTTLTHTSSVTTPPAVATSTQYITSGTFTATETPTSTATSNTGASTSTTSHQNQSWIDGHWKYILMLAIIVVALALLAWLAVWLKRRHRRKLDAKRAAASGFNYDPEKRSTKELRQSATPDLWGPHQMMQATQGYAYTTDMAEVQPEKGKAQKYRGADTKRLTKEAIQIVDTGEGPSARPSTKRARPSELEVNARMIGAADRRSKSRAKSSRGPVDKEIEAAQPEPPKVKSKRADPDVEKT